MEGRTVRVQRVFAAMLVAGVACLWALCAWPQDDAMPEEPHPAPGGAPGVPHPAPGGDVLPPPQPEPEIPEEIVAPEPAPEPEAPAEVTPAPTRPTRRPTPVRPRITTKSRDGARRAPAFPGAGGPSNAAPDIRPADTLPKDGGTPTEEVSFDFNNAALSDVVAAIGRMTGRNFDVDPTIAQTQVTVITHDKIPPEMAYQVLESLLSSRNFSMVETLGGKLIKIVPTGESPEKVPLVKGTEGVPPGYDTLSTHVVTVKYADASELTEILMKLGSKSLSITSYGRTNTLIITDTADGLRRVFKFLEEVDIPGYDTEMEIFTLEYSRAEVLAQQVQDVLMDTGGAAARGVPGQQGVRAGAAPTRPATPTRLVRPTVPGQNAPTVVGSREEVLRIVPDERLNAIIVIATASLMERVRDLVAKLDTPTPYEANNMNVYHLLNAPADKMEEALNALVGTTPRQASDKGGGGGAAGEVQPFEKKVAIKRYEQTNSLLILASPQDYKLIKEIIAQLDVPQRQVMVEAVIMDVSIQDTYGLSVDMASVTGNDAFALGNTSNISSLLDATKLADSLASGTAAITVAQSLLGLSKTGGMTAGAYHAIDVTVNGKEYKVPFVPFLIRALQTLTDIDILSKPSLATQDNKPADIIVGQEIPVPTQRSGYTYNPSSTSTQTQQYNYGLTSYGRGISREDVGVKMKVTPHINEGDYVSIETEIEVSEATPSSVGIDANELGPTFNKNKITNNVVVKDGGTGVVAGLIKETVSHSGNQTPALSDVPLIGWLFRTRNDTRKKQNVVVLITPFIVKDSADLDRVTKYKMDEFRTQNADALFEEGFVKRIKKRHYMRTKHHPSIERSEEMTDEQRFGRGDVERP